MEIPAGKKYEQPDAGVFIGTIIDVVFLPNYVPKKQNPAFPKPPQDRLQIVWILDKADKDGRPFRITEQPPFKMVNGTKKSRLYEIFEGVFQGAIPVPYESEDLMGKSNRLFLAKDGEYTNIKGFMPLSPGDVAPKAPSDFVRSKDRKAGQPAQQQVAKPVTVPAAESEEVQF
jgi:hypothetical protein